ncbi:hypothetical protein [Nocardia farcinica]|uniref:Uncharacterized protein n=1 Tax=Nocardia farcinica (strain IFM 10152) TaxID=247156 RepID=Q5YSN6_NOCFA|nr:hypothetical protein [Nocardia farcinica]BAD58805.1 hypothetical protein NFA_39570 [Nocardia farcinica IFM 10152]
MSRVYQLEASLNTDDHPYTHGIFTSSENAERYAEHLAGQPLEWFQAAHTPLRGLQAHVVHGSIDDDYRAVDAYYIRERWLDPEPNDGDK